MPRVCHYGDFIYCLIAIIHSEAHTACNQSINQSTNRSLRDIITTRATGGSADRVSFLVEISRLVYSKTSYLMVAVVFTRRIMGNARRIGVGGGQKLNENNSYLLSLILHYLTSTQMHGRIYLLIC